MIIHIGAMLFFFFLFLQGMLKGLTEPFLIAAVPESCVQVVSNKLLNLIKRTGII